MRISRQAVDFSAYDPTAVPHIPYHALGVGSQISASANAGQSQIAYRASDIASDLGGAHGVERSASNSQHSHSHSHSHSHTAGGASARTSLLSDHDHDDGASAGSPSNRSGVAVGSPSGSHSSSHSNASGRGGGGHGRSNGVRVGFAVNNTADGGRPISNGFLAGQASQPQPFGGSGGGGGRQNGVHSVHSNVSSAGRSGKIVSPGSPKLSADSSNGVSAAQQQQQQQQQNTAMVPRSWSDARGAFITVSTADDYHGDDDEELAAGGLDSPHQLRGNGHDAAVLASSFAPTSSLSPHTHASLNGGAGSLGRNNSRRGFGALRSPTGRKVKGPLIPQRTTE